MGKGPLVSQVLVPLLEILIQFSNIKINFLLFRFDSTKCKLYSIDHYSDSEELKVKEETGATIRCFPFEQPEGTKKCLMTGNPADEVAIFAKSY